MVQAVPISSGSENAVSLPPGCKVIGDYFGDGVQKCTADPVTGDVKCFVAKVQCCGNGRVDGPIRDAASGDLSAPAETCEIPTTGCRAEDCTMCGDNIIHVDHGEACDRGPSNGLAGSNCNMDCKVPVCGNGLLEVTNSNPEEQCDGNSFKESDRDLPGVVCGDPNDPERRCKVFYCGDGRIDHNEVCDGSAFRPEHQGKAGLKCDNSCQVHFCGDGTTNMTPNCSSAGGASCSEQCDDANGSNNDACTNQCFTARCGDGFVQGDEQCDGSQYSAPFQAMPGKSCDNQCKAHYCGDGSRDAVTGEQCDDGNSSNYDACTTACQPNTCGDGHLYYGVEQCDYADPAQAPYCRTNCLINVCGDGDLRHGVEQCDDGNLTNGDGCSAGCVPDCRPSDTPSVYLTPYESLTISVGSCQVFYQAISHSGGAYPSQLAITATSGVAWAYIDGNVLVYAQCFPTTNFEEHYSHMECSVYCCGGCHEGYHYLDGHSAHYSAGSIWVAAYNQCGVSHANHYVNFYGYTFHDNYRSVFFDSPVSLILDDKISDVNKLPVSLSKFRLSAESDENDKVVWYGSKAVGILVWKPEVKLYKNLTGEDLFGTWTFGKKWKNGYEALASLDKNKDGWLRSEELEGIQVWVDQNSDAKVDPGEMFTLGAFEITGIATNGKSSLKNLLYGVDFILNDEGFERRSGKEKLKTIGQSFDWFVPKNFSIKNFESNIEDLKDKGYSLYQWKQVPLEYGDNKINGYLAVKKKGDSLEGFAFAAVKGATDRSRHTYRIGQSVLRVQKLKSKEYLLTSSLSSGQIVNLSVELDSKGRLVGKEVHFDMREYYNQIGGLKNVRMPNGSKDLPFTEEYTSELVIEPLTLLPPIFDQLGGK